MSHPTGFRAIQGGRAKSGSRALSPASFSPTDAEAQYPVSDWLVPAADQHGHSVRIIARVPPSIRHEVDVLITAHIFPWRTPSDFFRWALFFGLDFASRKSRNPDAIAMQSSLATWVGVMRVQQSYLDLEATLDQLGVMVEQLLARGAKAGARRILREVQAKLGTIEDEWWRKRYQEDLLRRYGSILQRKK